MRSRATMIMGAFLGLVWATDTWAQDQSDPTAKTTETPAMTEARERFQRGLKLFDDGNFEAARVEFERAYALAPSYKLLYNIGYCYKQLNDYVAATRSLERYLLEGGTEIPADKRGEVVEALYIIRPRLATLEITSNPEGATISVDDVPVGTTPFKDAVPVNPGRRKITASKAGRSPAIQVVTVAGKERLKVNLELEAGKTKEVVIERSKGVYLAPVITWSITGALGVATVVSGIVSLNAMNKQNDLLKTVGMDPAAQAKALSDQRSQTGTIAIVTDVLIGATIVSAAVATFVTIKALTRKDEAAPAPAGVSNLRFGVGPTRLSLSGEF